MFSSALRTLLLTGSLALAGREVFAQTTFSIGPQVGLNASYASYEYVDYETRIRHGIEAGVLGSLQMGYVALQPALLFSQKGYRLTTGTALSTSHFEDIYRLNYITLPVKCVVSPRKDGQGVQLLAGAYLALLVGGNYQRNFINGNSTKVTTGRIVPNQSPLAFDEYSSQRLDAGLIVGVGYRYKKLQLQANYTWGGVNLAVPYTTLGTHANASNYSRGWQASLAYLFGPKS
jgi:hypothetical protein